MQEDWEDAVLRVWLRHGAGEVAAQRLLILGAKWQKGAQAELYRDAEAVDLREGSVPRASGADGKTRRGRMGGGR